MVTRNDNGAGQDLARLCDVRAQEDEARKPKPRVRWRLAPILLRCPLLLQAVAEIPKTTWRSAGQKHQQWGFQFDPVAKHRFLCPHDASWGLVQ